jgi:hypothetical protein
MARVTYEKPKIEVSLLKAVDAILCKPVLDQTDFDRIASIVVSGFKPESSPFSKAIGDNVVSLAVMHRLTSCKTGLSIFHNLPSELVRMAVTDEKRAMWLAATHPNEFAREEALRTIEIVIGHSIDRTVLYAAIEKAIKEDKLVEKLYPASVYQAYAQQHETRINSKKDASKAQKEANKAALETAIESAEKITGK